MEFERYKRLVEKYYQNDCRELNFQNRVIIPFLESFLPKSFDVVDSSSIYKNWKNYKDDDGNIICREKFADNYTPDLLITENWKLFDNEKIAPYISIEVKRPTALDRLHAEKEVEEYLTKAEHVILTDSITWEFYSKDKKGISQEFFYLDKDAKKVCQRGLSVGRKVNWNQDDRVWHDLKKKINELIPCYD